MEKLPQYSDQFSTINQNIPLFYNKAQNGKPKLTLNNSVEPIYELSCLSKS